MGQRKLKRSIFDEGFILWDYYERWSRNETNEKKTQCFYAYTLLNQTLIHMAQYHFLNVFGRSREQLQKKMRKKAKSSIKTADGIFQEINCSNCLRDLIDMNYELWQLTGDSDFFEYIEENLPSVRRTFERTKDDKGLMSLLTLASKIWTLTEERKYKKMMDRDVEYFNITLANSKSEEKVLGFVNVLSEVVSNIREADFTKDLDGAEKLAKKYDIYLDYFWIQYNTIGKSLYHRVK